jgi:hypothetical protein
MQRDRVYLQTISKQVEQCRDKRIYQTKILLSLEDNSSETFDGMQRYLTNQIEDAHLPPISEYQRVIMAISGANEFIKQT